MLHKAIEIMHLVAITLVAILLALVLWWMLADAPVTGFSI